jgi:hypothetical protein
MELYREYFFKCRTARRGADEIAAHHTALSAMLSPETKNTALCFARPTLLYATANSYPVCSTAQCNNLPTELSCNTATSDSVVTQH